jgi:uncharacterized metal-binding protein YceD (DUF177 family)
MGIPFSRIGKEPIAFEVKINDLILKGEIAKDKNELALLIGKTSGKLRLTCDICSNEFDCDISEDVKLLISDGVYAIKGEELDEAVIEQSGAIDLEEILRGEIASIECDYHRCQICEKLN